MGQRVSAPQRCPENPPFFSQNGHRRSERQQWGAAYPADGVFRAAEVRHPPPRWARRSYFYPRIVAD